MVSSSMGIDDEPTQEQHVPKVRIMMKSSRTPIKGHTEGPEKGNISVM